VQIMTPTTRRTDAEIFAEARSALDRRPGVPQGVHVHVDGGDVTLTGSVRWPFERADAEAAVRSIEGLRTLRNDIVVSQTASPAGYEPPEEPR
jgi:osmotically-inducible protein OsmY